jgi:hypothetical protein
MGARRFEFRQIGVDWNMGADHVRPEAMLAGFPPCCGGFALIGDIARSILSFS